jgi:hypothetical protein
MSTATIRKTYVGSTFQLNTHGNSLKGTAQGTSVQLGSLNNTSTFYRDPTNPCQTSSQTNKASSFINKQLVYITTGAVGVSTPATLGLSNGNPYRIWADTSTSFYSVLTVQNASSASGNVVIDGYFLGKGGNGGNSQPASAGQPGGNGSSAIIYSPTGTTQVTVAGSGLIFGGAGGGGGGGGAIWAGAGYNGTGGGGGGGNAYGQGGHAQGGGGQPGQPNSTLTGGSGGTGFHAGPGYYYGLQGGGGTGGNGGSYPSLPGQPGQPGYTLYDSFGSIFVGGSGGAGGTAAGAISGATVNWQMTNHN